MDSPLDIGSGDLSALFICPSEPLSVCVCVCVCVWVRACVRACVRAWVGGWVGVTYTPSEGQAQQKVVRFLIKIKESSNPARETSIKDASEKFNCNFKYEIRF